MKSAAFSACSQSSLPTSAGLSAQASMLCSTGGQEGCGIVVNDDGTFVSHKAPGLVSEVFHEQALCAFPLGSMAIGHVRYATTGCNGAANVQPLLVNHQKGRMALAHNGNLANAAKLRDRLELSGAIFHTTSDTEIIAYTALCRYAFHIII